LLTVADMNSPGLRERPGKVLLVDDDCESRDLVRFTLEREGHVVAAAAGGIEGLELAREFQPDIAFVDIMMPGLDGYAVASALRRDLGPAAWIVALTGLPEHRSKNWVSGFKLHLRKPVSPEMIREIVRAALSEGASV
jgi:CheY-like chemotaxis protein